MLGNQPPPPGTTPLRYVVMEDRTECLDLEITQDYDYDEDLLVIDLSQDMVREQASTSAYINMDMNQLMYVSSQGSRGYRKTPVQSMSQCNPSTNPPRTYQQ